LQQQKLVAYTISKIKPNQDKFEWMDISVQDFNSLCGKTGNPGSNDYVIFRDSIMGLSETFFLEEIETEEDGTAKRDKNGNYIKKTTNVNWIDFELEERVNSKGEVIGGYKNAREKWNKLYSPTTGIMEPGVVYSAKSYIDLIAPVVLAHKKDSNFLNYVIPYNPEMETMEEDAGVKYCGEGVSRELIDELLRS
jgi:hypothetical protein